MRCAIARVHIVTRSARYVRQAKIIVTGGMPGRLVGDRVFD